MSPNDKNAFEKRLSELDATHQRQAAMLVKERLLTAKAIARTVLLQVDDVAVAHIALQLAQEEARWNES